MVQVPLDRIDCRRDPCKDRLECIWRRPISETPFGKSIVIDPVFLDAVEQRPRLGTYPVRPVLVETALESHNHKLLISETSAQQIRDTRDAFVRYFGGGEYIPEYDAGSRTIEAVVIRPDDQQTLDTVGKDTDEADAATTDSFTES